MFPSSSGKDKQLRERILNLEKQDSDNKKRMREVVSNYNAAGLQEKDYQKRNRWATTGLDKEPSEAQWGYPLSKCLASENLYFFFQLLLLVLLLPLWKASFMDKKRHPV